MAAAVTAVEGAGSSRCRPLRSRAFGARDSKGGGRELLSLAWICSAPANHRQEQVQQRMGSERRVRALCAAARARALPRSLCLAGSLSRSLCTSQLLLFLRRSLSATLSVCLSVGRSISR